MLLTRANVIGYLISRGLLDTRATVHDGICVVEVSRRNTSFHITRRTGEGLAVKQVADWRTASSEALRREAVLYARAGEPTGDVLLSSVRDYLAPCHGYDAEQHVLTLGLLTPAVSLAEWLRQPVPVDEGEIFMAQLGHVLGRLHRETGTKAGRAGLGADFPAWVPWVMQATGEFVDVDDSSTQQLAVRQLRSLLQRHPALHTHLTQLRREWRAACLIHTDLKGEHGLIYHGQLKLIDWEMATVGDPGWDVGSVFALCLLHWVEAAAQGSATTSQALLAAQHHIANFWAAYIKARALRPAQRANTLRQSMRFTAARLIQTAYEDAHARPDLSPREALLLQLGQNILGQPDEAVQRVLGL